MVLPAFLRIYAASPQRDDDRSVFAGRDCDAEGAYSLLRVLDSPPCLDSPIRGVYSPIKKLWGRTPRNHCKTRISAQSPATVPAGGHLRPSRPAHLQHHRHQAALHAKNLRDRPHERPIFQGFCVSPRRQRSWHHCQQLGDFLRVAGGAGSDAAAEAVDGRAEPVQLRAKGVTIDCRTRLQQCPFAFTSSERKIRTVDEIWRVVLSAQKRNVTP